MGAVNSISATQSGQYLASAGHDGHVYFWNVASGKDYFIDGRYTQSVPYILGELRDNTLYSFFRNK